jgi:hypothetical protein
METSSSDFQKAHAIYQSWYCLAHESRRIRNYNLSRSKEDKRRTPYRLGVIVGHGSGMTLQLHRQNGGYPTDLLTEDLTLGYILSVKNIPILSLPALEIASVPGEFNIFIKQRSVWFWNYLGYIVCYRKMRQQGYPSSRLSSLLFQGIAGGAYWFGSSLFVIIPVLLSVFLHSYLLLASILISALIFCILPHYILLRTLPSVLLQQEFPDISKHVANTSFFRLLPSLCLIILADSIGPWIATLQCFQYLVTGRLPRKYKTGD